MRCLACNCILDDFEATRRYKRNDDSRDYVQLCNTDFEYIKDVVHVIERKDLKDQSLEDDDGPDDSRI